MDVKAEVVLLIFTLNCVTLILLSQDLIRYRLCQDRFANYPACIGTGVTTTADPIDSDSTTGTTFTPTTSAAATTTTTTKNNTTSTTITTTDITPTTDSTTVSITNKIIPVSATTNTTIPTTPDFLISHLTPLLIRSPAAPPPSYHHQQQFSPQQLPLQSLPLPPSLPINERENIARTPSSPPSSPGSVDMNFTSGRYEGGDGKDDLRSEVETCSLIIIATFVSTSVASSQVLGRWIDRWSCRTLALFPLVGLEAWAVCGLLVCSTPSIPLYLWFVGAALGGSAGGFVTLKASTTLYAVQATPRWDGTVRLAVLQAATTLGVLIAYLSLYIIADDPQSSMTSIFLGITILGIVNVFFAFIFSDKPPMTPVTTTTTTTTTPRGNASGTQMNAHNSRPSLVLYVPREEGEVDEDKEEEGEEDVHDGDDDDAKGEKENVGKEGKYRKNALIEVGMEKDNECNEKQEEGEEATASSMNQNKTDANVGSSMHSSFHVDNLEIPPNDERQEEIKEKVDSTQRAKRKRKLGVIYNFERLTPWNEEEERSQDPVLNYAAPSVDYGSLCYPQSPIEVMQNFSHLTPCNEEEQSKEPVMKTASPSVYCGSMCYPQSPIPIIISFEDGSSVYGTPPENSSLLASCCGTPPSRTLSSYASCTSLETTTEAATGGQQDGLSTHQQQPEARAGVSPNDLRHENRPYYERLRHQCTGLSSSAPSTFSNLMEPKSNVALHSHLDKMQSVNMPRVSDSQDDLLMTPNVLLTPASSRSSVLSCEESNSSSSSGESRDVMRGEEGNILYDCASLGDMQRLSQLSVNTNSYFYDSASLRQSGSMMTIQTEGVGEVGEREGRESLAPLTMAGESSGEGVCCAGGGGAGRCLACVVGRLLCRPVSVTFRRRAAGLKGIVVADVVAAFLVSVVAAGVWEVTPLYLEVKLEWSLADWVSYMACRCGLGVVALLVVLPLLRRRLSLQDTTLGVLGGLSSLLSSVCLSFLTSSATSTIPLALLFGPLTLYLNVASAAILMRLVGITELGGVLLCLGSVQQAGHVTGWLTFYYLYPFLLRHRMPGVAFVTAGLLLLVPSTIFGVLHFSLGLRTRCLTPDRTASPTLSTIPSQRDPGELQR